MLCAKHGRLTAVSAVDPVAIAAAAAAAVELPAMKQKKKKDDPQQQPFPPPPPSSQPSAAAAATDEKMQQQLCNGGEPAKKPKKSALKRTGITGGGGGGGSSKAAAKSGKNKRRVQFNESLNVFFESDYVIVIRDDDCDFDEEDFDFWSQQPCSCGDASCFQPWLDDDDGGGRGLPPPPLDPYEEQPGTLSPPDGYKDGCPRHVPPQSLDHLKYGNTLQFSYSDRTKMFLFFLDLFLFFNHEHPSLLVL